MNKKWLLGSWAALFFLTAGLGFVREAAGAVLLLQRAAAWGFFVPPALLLRQAFTGKDRSGILLIRNLAFLSLALTAVLLALNFLSVLGTEGLGTLLYAMLTVVSSPMICSGLWAMSLFLWACLLLAAQSLLKKL